ncbi:formyltetrahydrofolate deformylase [Solimonas terrae]|uniref:Formyltetrahydrofolate deformylase n=1 Tax=Solimonas terrae TaxID=1396819 RepID=A0A6M2BPH2_9GAMM|nr:formyltetrahydrofolate deformylase [Solimonas terrae]NGY04131.1 formyltetrahydrofolate deformylase [Solimonas terrae]
MSADHHDLVLTFLSPDRPGILAAVTACVFKAGCDIRDAQQFGDDASRTFFVRMHLSAPVSTSESALSEAIATVAGQLDLRWSLRPWQRKLRSLILVSKYGHCLNDLLHRWRTGLLHTDIVGVVSNHEDFRSLTQWYGLPFHHLPVTPDTKAAQEAKILELVESTQTDLVVLARYMQVLSENLCRQLDGRCINIHHSFLPSFKGASPYKRAYERGVKLVGATAHYVTSDLDEGPIIEQDVVRVNHAMNADEMTNLGREVEARVLARAVRWHVEHRVILNAGKTIVFQ